MAGRGCGPRRRVSCWSLASKLSARDHKPGTGLDRGVGAPRLSLTWGSQRLALQQSSQRLECTAADCLVVARALGHADGAPLDPDVVCHRALHLHETVDVHAHRAAGRAHLPAEVVSGGGASVVEANEQRAHKHATQRAQRPRRCPGRCARWRVCGGRVRGGARGGGAIARRWRLASSSGCRSCWAARPEVGRDHP
eukprot:362860-Chlamydomonas_euryale.AAC.17